MRILSISLMFAGLLTAARAADAPAAPIYAGPVYTRGQEAGVYPQYPDLQIQVEVPPSTSPELLKPEAFRVKADNGSPVTASRVQTLASTNYGIAVSVALDVSGSMKGGPLNAVRTGLGKFVNDAGPHDKIAIQTIADDSRWDANWEDSREKVRGALDGLAARGKLTRLWDALLEAAGHFEDSPLSQRIIVISDGHDEGSLHSEEEVIAAAHQHRIVVDAIGITRSNPVYLQGLQRLAEETGGLFREARSTTELENLVGSGIDRLKAIPVATFRMDDLPGDGAPHHFLVTWKHEGTESAADVTAAVPRMPVPLHKNRWLWIGGGAAALLLILLLVILMARGRRRSAPVLVSPPVAAPALAPAPIPPPPVRVSARPLSGEPLPAPLKPRKVEMPPQEPPAPAPAPPPPPAPAKIKTQLMARFPKPTKERPAAWLLCEEGLAAGKKFPVDEIEYWIGALDSNHLQIADDPTVSGNHACLVFDHDVLGIYDHHSTNGTRVNGELLNETKRLLRPGDRIRVGQHTFCLQLADREGHSS